MITQILRLFLYVKELETDIEILLSELDDAVNEITILRAEQHGDTTPACVTETQVSGDNQGASRKKHVHPKDWDRRARIVAALSEKRMTVSELAKEIERSQGYVSAIIWGVDRYFSVESAIAAALGRTWDDLFAPATNAKGRAA